MRFKKYYISASVVSGIGDLRRAMKIIDSHIIEVENPVPDAICVGTEMDVIEKIGSLDFIVSSSCVIESANLGHRKIGVTKEKRQIISRVLAESKVAFVGCGERQVQKVLLLSGSIVSACECNVLVAELGLDQQVITARERHVPIVSSEWIDEVFRLKEFISVTKFALPVFSGCVFASADLVSAVWKPLRELVVANGGVWKNVLDGSTCLVVGKVVPNEKVWRALQNRIRIVRHDLVTDYSRGTFREISKYVFNWWTFDRSLQSRLFAGITFGIADDVNEADQLREFIEAHGGAWGRIGTHLIVSHGRCKGAKECQVSVNWVLACVEAGRVIDIGSNIIYRPVKFQVPMVIMLSGICDTVRLELVQMIRGVGGTVVYHTSDTVQFVIAQKVDRSVVDWTNERQIPLVTPHFVVEVIASGKIPDPKRFAVIDDAELERLCRTMRRKCAPIKDVNVLTSMYSENADQQRMYYSRKDVSSKWLHSQDRNMMNS